MGFEVDEEVHPNNSPKRTSVSNYHDATRTKKVVEYDTNIDEIAKTF